MRRRLLVTATAAAVVLVGGGVAYAQAQGASGSYRTATVTVGDVEQTLMLSGTIAASSRQDLSFGVAGTITKLGVEVGDAVKAGSVIAVLDDSDLQTAVTKARATLAKAKAQLESDQASQSSTVASGADTGSADTGASGSDSGGTKSTEPTSGGSGGTSPKLKAALASLTKQQAAVTTAQTAATTAIAAAKSALAAQADACKVEDTPDVPEDSGDESVETTETAGLSDECTAALDAVQAAQDVVADKQAALQTALEVLAKTLNAAVAEIQKSGSGASTSDSADSSESGDSAATAPSSAQASGSGGGTVSAASLAQDQAAIDTARAALTEAKRSLDAAELTAPFSGKVLSVSAGKGDSVAADDVVVVIAGDGENTATTTVTVDQVPEVEKGQKAAVTPAGATEPVAATVTSIGLLPESGSDATTYPVTLELTGTVAAPEGSTASIALVIGTAEDALTVPSSAVSTSGRTTVSVLTDGTPTRTAVTVGVVGPTRTQIAKGLKAGQEVVIADLDTPLPSGDGTTTQLPGFGGGGGFPSVGRPRRAG